MDAEVLAANLEAMTWSADTGRIVALVGPTASGKTELATRLAERIGGEVVSADSVQVYRRFDLGSGKPSREELARAPHHVIDILDPGDAIDAARYAELASLAIDDIRARGKHPVVCGGTFLWVKALLYGLAEAPSANQEIRARHQAVVQAEGREALHHMLAAVDAASAARLHPNDTVRVGRALEVYELTGTTLTELQEKHAFGERRHPATLFARKVPADVLTERIRARVDGWLEAGWIEEVAALVADGHGNARALGSVGFREILAHLRGELPRGELGPAIVRATRVFARRQRTWLNHADVTWLA